LSALKNNVKSLSTFDIHFFYPVHVTLTGTDHISGTDSLKVFERMYYDVFLHDYKLLETIGVSLNKFHGGKLFPADLMNNYFNGKLLYQ